MKKLLTIQTLWVIALIGLAFLLSACYTQLAKPNSKVVEEEYYVEDVPQSEEVDSAQVEEDVSGYEEEHVVRRYYHDIHYYGFYGTPWWFDPFFDPYFYGYYSPYSSYVSFHIGFYDPFFFANFYYPYSYWHRGYYWGYGCYRPVRGHFYSYYPGYFAVANPVPFRQRTFVRRGTRLEDNLGRRESVSNVNGSSGSSLVSTKPISQTPSVQPSSSTRRQRNNDSKDISNKIERREGSVSATKKYDRRTPKSRSDNQPVSKPVSEISDDKNKRVEKTGDVSSRRSKRTVEKSYKSSSKPVAKSVSKEGEKPKTQTVAKEQSNKKSSNYSERREQKSSGSYHKPSSGNSSGHSGSSYKSGGSGGYKSSGSAGSHASSSGGRRARR
jgi:uncharacterized membrane protein YgcG